MTRGDTDRSGSMRQSGPKSIGNLVGRLLARTGYDQEQGPQRLAAAWAAAVPAALAGLTVPGRVRQGILEVLASHSAAVQELGFHKAEILRRLAEAVPEEPLTDIRCRLTGGVGAEPDRGAAGMSGGDAGGP